MRFLINHRGILRETFQLTFTNKDSSLYLFLSKYFKKYQYGKFDIPEGVESFEIRCNSGFESEKVPQLSYHESGQIHIKKQDGNYLIIKKKPLYELNWNHILTVQIVDVTQLPEYKGRRREHDQVVESFIGNSACFIIFVNALGKIVPVDFDVYFSLYCQYNRKEIDIGCKFREKLPISSTGEGGMIILAGWDINQSDLPEDEGLFIHGK